MKTLLPVILNAVPKGQAKNLTKTRSFVPMITIGTQDDIKGLGRFPFFLFALAILLHNESHSQIAVRGETVYTMAGQPIKDGVVLLRGNKIERVGPASQVNIPSNYKVMTAKIVTPGLVDAHSVVGLAGIYNAPHDQMQLETSSPMQPELRAIDAYNPREALVAWIRNLGVTTVHTGPGPGALASGTTIVVKTVGNTVADALIDSVGMVAFTLGSSVSQNFRSPGTRSKSVAMIRSEFIKAQEYIAKMKEKDPSKRPARDLKMDILAKVLSGEMKAMFTAEQTPDIMATLQKPICLSTKSKRQACPLFFTQRWCAPAAKHETPRWKRLLS